MIKYLSQEQTKLIYKSRAWLTPLILFALIMIAFPLSIDLFGKQTSDLFMIIIVISLLLTNYLAVDDILLEDYEDGSFEQFLTQNKSLFSSVLAKLIILIIYKALPLSLLTILFASVNNVDAFIFLDLFLISFFCQILFLNIFLFGSALGINKGGLLGLIVVMPLVFPVIIIFGQSLTLLQNNSSIDSFLLLSLGISFLITPMFSYLSSLILKMHLE